MLALNAGYAPMLAAWMGGALLSLASAELRHRVGIRGRGPAPAVARPSAVRVGRRAAALHR
jgi:hypothetical protein